MDNKERLKIAYQWLVDGIGVSPEDARMKAEDVNLHIGDITDWAWEHVQEYVDMGSIPNWVMSYFDYNKYIQDQKINESLVEHSPGVWITNANEF